MSRLVDYSETMGAESNLGVMVELFGTSMLEGSHKCQRDQAVSTSCRTLRADCAFKFEPAEQKHNFISCQSGYRATHPPDTKTIQVITPFWAGGAMAWWLERLFVVQEDLGSIPAVAKLLLSPRVYGGRRKN